MVREKNHRRYSCPAGYGSLTHLIIIVIYSIYFKNYVVLLNRIPSSNKNIIQKPFYLDQFCSTSLMTTNLQSSANICQLQPQTYHQQIFLLETDNTANVFHLSHQPMFVYELRIRLYVTLPSPTHPIKIIPIRAAR